MDPKDSVSQCRKIGCPASRAITFAEGIERRDDLLLSTLRQYLAATGAEHPKIVIEKNGVEITLDLDTFA